MVAASKLSMAYNGSHRSFGTCASNGWWWIHVRRKGWHISTLDLWMVADSRLSERLAQLAFGSVREVGIAWTQLPSFFSFCLQSQALQLKSTLNPSERLAQLDSASNMLFRLLMVTSSSMEVGLKAQNATQISRAQLPARFSFCLWSQAFQRK